MFMSRRRTSEKIMRTKGAKAGMSSSGEPRRSAGIRSLLCEKKRPRRDEEPDARPPEMARDTLRVRDSAADKQPEIADRGEPVGVRENPAGAACRNVENHRVSSFLRHLGAWRGI